MVTINGNEPKTKKWETLCKECGGEKVYTEGYRGTYCTCNEVDPKEWKNANEGVSGVTIVEYINEETGESRVETSDDVK